MGDKIHCKKKNIPKLSKRLTISLEECGRLLRYRDLRKIADQNNLIICTGHHSQDYFESVLIHLTRGGGPNAMETLPILKENLFRPLLVFPDAEYKKLLENLEYPVFEDESNMDQSFFRNEIRHSVLPILIKRGINFHKLHENFHPRAYVESFPVTRNWESGPEFVQLDCRTLLASSSSQQKIILDTHLRALKLHPSKRNFWNLLIRSIFSGNSFLLENKECFFWKSENFHLYILPKSAKFLCAPKVTEKGLEWNGRVYKLPGKSQIQSYLEFTTIRVGNMNRKISELHREREIPLPVRRNIPLLVEENHVSRILYSLWDRRLGDLHAD